MLSEAAEKELIKQQYRIVGDHKHSAVKVCGWTKSLIMGKGGCYKLKFYGIRSNQCMQMTTSISCANRCTFCWRGYKAPVAKEWKWGVDDPVQVLEQSLAAHHALLVGYKGNEKANKDMYEKSNTVRHVAMSLTGEPIIYPRMNELVVKFHEEKISTFLVTNAQYPEQLENLYPITQLYISLDAPNKPLLKKVDVPLFEDYWERLNTSLEHLSKRKDRTVIRLTCIKEMNMVEPENYAKLILKGDPEFIEVKGYMHIGASQLRLKKENMPTHDEVKAFGLEVAKYLPDYEYVSQHRPSTVILLAKKKYNRRTWINYDKFFEDYPKMLAENELSPAPLAPQQTTNVTLPKL